MPVLKTAILNEQKGDVVIKLIVLPRLVNTIPYHVVPAKAEIHALHDQNSTSGMDPHPRGDDNKVPNLQDEAVVSLIPVLSVKMGIYSCPLFPKKLTKELQNEK